MPTCLWNQKYVMLFLIPEKSFYYVWKLKKVKRVSLLDIGRKKKKIKEKHAYRIKQKIKFIGLF